MAISTDGVSGNDVNHIESWEDRDDEKSVVLPSEENQEGTDRRPRHVHLLVYPVGLTAHMFTFSAGVWSPTLRASLLCI